METISLFISGAAFAISLGTFWLTRVRKGSIKMTRPNVIFFGPDGRNNNLKKVFARTLLYSTAEKGNYIQNMYVRLQRGENVQNFNVWVYDNTGLVRGSGLFVDKKGTASNHHFLMPKDGTSYEFLSGEYLLQIHVELVNQKPLKLFEEKLIVTKEQEQEMKNNTAGIYFDWAPNSQNYQSHVDFFPITNPFDLF